MKPFAFLIVVIFIIGCKKENNLIDKLPEETLVTGFAYVNPQGKQLDDSVIILPKSGYIIDSDSPYEVYNGATFINNSYWERTAGSELSPDSSLFVKWTVKDLTREKFVKSDTTTDLRLELFEIGKFKITQYLYTTSENRKESVQALDSLSKIVEVVNVRKVDSITIDSLGFGSPYLNAGLDRNAPFDVFVSIYKNADDLATAQDPLFQSGILENIKFGATNLKLEIPESSFIPSFVTLPDSDVDILLQLNVRQAGKVYTLLNNERGNSIVRSLQTGYLATDNATSKEELRLWFQSTSMKINTSFMFMN